MADELFVYTDGGARGNPGPAAIGVVIHGENNKILSKISRKIGETTNNVAEYMAVIEALKWIKNSCQLSVVSCQFFLDSKLVVNQLNGIFKIKDANLRNLLVEIRQLEQEIGGNISYFLIPREKNWQADLLVNQALDGS
jgi:ribonuclease HI